MANILRMDLYRLVHGKSLWIMLAIVVAISVMSVGMMAYIAGPEFAATLQSASANGPGSFHVGIAVEGSPDASDLEDIAEAGSMMTSGMTAEALVGTMFLNGGGLAVIFVIFIAIFLTAEFESGFSKNVFTVQPNRLAFLAARTIEVVVLAAAFTVVTTVATIAMAFATGIVLAPLQPVDLLLWGALVTLGLAGFGMLTALAAWVTRKMTASLVAGILLGAGLAALLVQGFVLLVPSASFLANFTLSACLASLSHGVGAAAILGSPHIALVSFAFIALCAVAGGIALQKKDI